MTSMPLTIPETVRDVDLVAPNGAYSGDITWLDVYLSPPSQDRPGYSRIGVIEAVGPETNISTIIQGNANRNGAQLSLYNDRVQVQVAVQGQGGWGAPGKFKATYRVFWEEVAGRTAKYGDAIKLRHGSTPTALHSHALNYRHAGSSGQQQVTTFAGSDDNDLWRVKGRHGQSEDHKFGQPVQHGDVIRLEHMLTRRNLHSHDKIPSPVGQQEVTAFGTQGFGDTNDDWRVEVDGGGTWDAGKRVRLIHDNTNRALHSHSPADFYVTGFAGRDDNDWWVLFEIRPVARFSAAAFVSQAVPGTMVVGRSYEVAVTLRNTGTTLWTRSGVNPFRLGSQNPQDNGIWGRVRVELPEDVAPGAPVTLRFPVTAPMTAGRHNFQWRMVHELVTWFGDFTPNVSVGVTLAQLAVGVEPYPVPVGTPVQAVVRAADRDTGQPVAGTARITNPGATAQVFPTNTPFTFTFRTRLVRRGSPTIGFWYDTIAPSGVVSVPGYVDASIDFGLSETGM